MYHVLELTLLETEENLNPRHMLALTIVINFKQTKVRTKHNFIEEKQYCMERAQFLSLRLFAMN